MNPRKTSGQLIAALQKLGYYEVARRTAHTLMRHDDQPVHSITIPTAPRLKAETLQHILAEVAERRSVFLEAMTYLF
jgi:predicted RNA binding protein YcfA (HicA-like mRNA interferase family)